MRILVLCLLMCLPAMAAIGPEEVLEDRALQARAMALYQELRCVRCQSENIASSNADWASDARMLVRERLLAGDSDREVKAYFQARYGDYVLMNPPLSARNIGLWLMGPVLLLFGGVLAFWYLRGRATAVPAPVALSPEEQRRIDALRQEGGGS